MNTLVSQYLAKATDLSIYSQEQLEAIAHEINYRPHIGMVVRFHKRTTKGTFTVAGLFEKELDFLIFHASVLESQVHREYGSAFRNEIKLKLKKT